MSTKRKIQVRSEPTSYDAEAGTITIVYATATPAQRWGYIEILDMSEGAIDTTRLDAGAVNILLQHDGHFGLPIGNVVSHEIVDGIATATFRLSVADEHRGIVSNISAGIYRTWSVGYQIMETEEETREDGVTVVRVTRWMPMEISLVSIPADPESKTRSDERPAAGAIVHRTVTAPPQMKGQSPMTTRNLSKPARRRTAAEEAAAAVEEETGTELTEDQVAAVEAAVETAIADAVADVEAGDAEEGEEARAEGDEGPEADPEADAADPATDEEEEATRAAEIVNLCARHGRSIQFAQRHIKRGTPTQEVRNLVLDEIAARSPKPMSNARIRRDERETMVSRAANAIYSRMTGTEPTADARELRYLSTVEMARAFVGPAATSMPKDQVIRSALQTRSGMHTTSDFAAAIGNAANRTLRQAYAAAELTYADFIREVSLPDFRATERIQIGDAPVLLQRKEGSETTRGTLSDAKESIQLATFARALAMTRPMMVNDDLGAFARVLTSFGIRAAELQSDLVYGVLTGNPKMADGKTLFHASHGNMLQLDLSVDGLSEGRKLMRKQVGLDGAKLNLQATSLIVGPDLETAAQKLIAPISAVVSDGVNPFAGSSLKLVVDSRIEDNSWYLAANPGLIDTIELAFLDGARGIQTQTIDNPMFDGVDVLAQIDVEAAAIDYRGLIRSKAA